LVYVHVYVYVDVHIYIVFLILSLSLSLSLSFSLPPSPSLSQDALTIRTGGGTLSLRLGIHFQGGFEEGEGQRKQIAAV